LDFDPDNVQNIPWDRINSKLGSSTHNKGGDEWEDEDVGWCKKRVTTSRCPFLKPQPSWMLNPTWQQICTIDLSSLSFDKNF
jgi:hypothetical protein